MATWLPKASWIHRRFVGLGVISSFDDAVEDTAVVHPWHAARLVRQHRLDGSPLMVSEFVAHDSAPPVRGLNHSSAVRLNMLYKKALWSLCTPKAARPDAKGVSSSEHIDRCEARLLCDA